MTVTSDPYAATYFRDGCARCDALWAALMEATGADDFETRVPRVHDQIREHARTDHGHLIAGPQRDNTAGQSTT